MKFIREINAIIFAIITKIIAEILAGGEDDE